MKRNTKQYPIGLTHVGLFRNLFAELQSWERAECTEVRATTRSVFVVRATVVGHEALREAMARVAPAVS